MGCAHLVAADHVHRQDPGGQRWWRCTTCGHVGLWGSGWVQCSNIECRKCQQPAVYGVYCPTCSPAAQKTHG